MSGVGETLTQSFVVLVVVGDAGEYPSGFFVCQFHKSLHIVSRSCEAWNPSSFSAIAGSAVRSGTSPNLWEGNRSDECASLRSRRRIPYLRSITLVL